MQAIKDKISEMGAMKQVKEEARAEEKVRLAKEAEAEMSHHVAKAGEIARAGEHMANEQLAKIGGSDAAARAGGGGVPNNAASNPLPTSNMSPPTYNKMP
ncbi:hypothetical protein ACLB2K_072576 [Fragaria x ananassa]